MALPQSPMVIYAGKGNVFEGEMSQPLERGAGGQPSRSNLGEKSFQLLGGHATWATGSRYSRKIASASAMDSI